jgi:ribose/xylose/arabinose/galactoside ABC-type transport system permease subunit
MNSVTADTEIAGGARSAPIGDFLYRHRARLALIGVIVALTIVTATQSSVFFTWTNFEHILIQISIVGILAVGTTMLMVSGGIDLSIGSNLSFSGVIMGDLMAHGTSPAFAVALGVGAATMVGLVNGTLAAYAKAHPFILTLGMLTLLQGAALLVSSLPISEIPEGFLNFGESEPFGIPLMVVCFLGIAVLVNVILVMTKFGRWLYAIGGSESAARLAGVPVRRIKMAVYALNGMLCGIAAALLLMQLTSAQAEMGAGLELTAIAAVAIGGTPLAGGKGSVAGTLLGVLLIGLIGNSLNLMSISSNWQYVVQGAVIVIAVMAQRD